MVIFIKNIWFSVEGVITMEDIIAYVKSTN